MQNSITEASGAYHVHTRFPRKHVTMVIALDHNPLLANPAHRALCIQQIMTEYPRITQMNDTIEYHAGLGRVLLIDVKGW